MDERRVRSEKRPVARKFSTPQRCSRPTQLHPTFRKHRSDAASSLHRDPPSPRVSSMSEPFGTKHFVTKSCSQHPPDEPRGSSQASNFRDPQRADCQQSRSQLLSLPKNPALLPFFPLPLLLVRNRALLPFLPAIRPLSAVILELRGPARVCGEQSRSQILPS
jgi:hypothetical protein